MRRTRRCIVRSRSSPASSGIFGTLALQVGSGIAADLTSGMRDESVRFLLIALGGVSLYVVGESLERSLRAECRPCALLLDATQPLLA